MACKAQKLYGRNLARADFIIYKSSLLQTFMMVGAYCCSMKGVSQLGRLETITLCGNCEDFVKAVPAGDNVNRCTNCGCYATDSPDVCCKRHELRSSPYPSGECPYCEEERNIKAQRVHEATRDPMMEPW